MAIALVTGGSRGIGRATALQLAQEGYTVAVNFHHNIRAATEVVNNIVAAGGKAFALRADISDESQVVAMFESIDREGEQLTALVNNAGILFEQSTVENLTAERINRVLATNVTGYFLCCREAVKRMSFKHGAQGGFDFENPAARIRLAVDQFRGVAKRVVNRHNLTTYWRIDIGCRFYGLRNGTIIARADGCANFWQVNENHVT